MIKFIEISSIIMYIDHSTIVFIFRQITLIIFNNDKLNLRLIKASQYLFEFNLFIRHKVDKTNVIFDVFFKFQTDASISEKIEILKSFYEHSLKSIHENLTVETSILYHHVSLIEMFDDFKQRLKQVYKNDEH